MNAEQAWRAALGQLQMEMPKAAYETWVAGTELITYEDGSFIVGVQNAYARDWLESRLASTVKRKLSGLMNRTVAVRFVVWQNPPESEIPSPRIDLHPEQKEQDSQPSNHITNNQKYTFENFVVGTRKQAIVWLMPPPLLSPRTRRTHITRYFSMEALALEKRIFCMQSVILVRKTVLTSCMCRQKNLPTT
jgi:hypothetical protein